MQSLKDRFRTLLAAVSPSQRVVIVVALAVLGIVAFVFYGWVTTPSYSILYTNLDDASLAKVIDQLNSLKATYKMNGNQVLVPMSDLYVDRAKLASANVGGQAVPPGYELFDNQSLTASSFTQQVDYQRALEGELDKTLLTMSGVKSASVRLAIPQDQVFTSTQAPVTAAVLLDTTATLPASEVDTVVFVVSSAVQGLSASNVTVADTHGTVLSAPGSASGGVASDRQAQAQQAMENKLTADVQHLVDTATGSAAAVVVHAQMDLNQQTIQSETYDPKATVPLQQAITTETLTGDPAAAAGILGTAGGTLSSSTTNTATSYNKSDTSTTYGAAHQVTSTTVAPGQVQKLSVGVVVDDGTKTHLPAPNIAQLTQLVSAAVGIDPARGDSINITAVPYPAGSASTTGATKPKTSVLALVPQVAAAAVLVIVAVFLLLMARGRRKMRGAPLELTATAYAALEPGGRGTNGSTGLDEPGALAPSSGRLPVLVGDRQDVMDLVTRQPEEIATLLRSWLADRRS